MIHHPVCVQDLFKSLVYSLWIAILTIISSIYPALIALFIVWIINFFMGLGADVHVNNKAFDIKKAFDSFKQLTYVGILMVVIYLVPMLMQDTGIGEKGVKYLTYIAVYFYTTNGTGNAKKIWPRWKLISFVHDLLSTQIFATLKQYLGIKKNENNPTTNQQN